MYYCGNRMLDTSCVLSMDRYLSHSSTTDFMLDILQQWVIITLYDETTGNMLPFSFVNHWSMILCGTYFQSFLTRYLTKHLISFVLSIISDAVFDQMSDHFFLRITEGLTLLHLSPFFLNRFIIIDSLWQRTFPILTVFDRNVLSIITMQYSTVRLILFGSIAAIDKEIDSPPFFSFHHWLRFWTRRIWPQKFLAIYQFAILVR